MTKEQFKNMYMRKYLMTENEFDELFVVVKCTCNPYCNSWAIRLKEDLIK